MRTISWTAIVVAIALSGGCTSPSRQLNANKELVRRFAATINEADWDAFDEMLTEDFHRHSQASPEGEVKSRDEFKKLQASFLESFPDQRITLDKLVAEGDHVAVSAVYSGTQSGPMGPFPATGESMSSHFLSFFRIEEGRIAELWVEWDNVAMLSQLGLFPAPDASLP